MKRKMFSLVLATLMILSLLCGCGKEADTFTVGFDAEFPPYGYQDENGEYTGFDLELAEELCKRLGWELVKKPIDWNAKDQELNTGSIDCIWNGFTIQGREDLYTWTVPYVDNSQVIVVKAGAGITGTADLAGKNLVVQADSSALAALTGEDDEWNDLGDGTQQNRRCPSVFRKHRGSGHSDHHVFKVDVRRHQTAQFTTP